MQTMSFGARVQLYPAPDRPPSPPPPAGGWATPPANAPIAWPSNAGRKVPVTGQLSPHVAAAYARLMASQK